MRDRLDRWYSAVAARQPDALALVADGRTISYAELDRLGDSVAELLSRSGVRPGELVGLRMARGWRVVPAILGVWKHGCGYVPVDPAYPQARQQYIVDEVGMGHVVADEEDYVVRSVDTTGRRPPEHPADTAYVMFTSGSTGSPKGVVIRHTNLVSLFGCALDALGVTDRDVWSQFHSHSFDFSVWETWGPLLSGGTCVIVPDPAVLDPRLLATFVRDRRITVLDLVPTVFAQLTDVLSAAGATLPDLRRVVLGGEAIRKDVAARWLSGGLAPAGALYNMYGITEVAVHGTIRHVTANEPDSLDSIGVPLPNTRIVLADNDVEVPDGTPGEILVSGGGVAWGYLGRPELTARRFVRLDFGDGTRTWYRSGDHAVRRADGELVYLGRRDDQVKIGGVRVEAGEVEQNLRAHPELADAAVVAVPCATGLGTQLVAVAAARSGTPPSDAELRRWLADRLPAAYLPRVFGWVAELPSGPNRKVDRAALQELARSLANPAAEDPAADDLLGSLWRRLVGDPGDGSVRFLDQGGSSLIASHLLAVVHSQLGVDLPVSLLLRDNCSLAELRCRAAGGHGPTTDTAAAAVPVDSSPLLPSQRRMWLLDRLGAEPAAYNVVGALRLRGGVRPDAVRAALSAVIARRDALRGCLIDSPAGEPHWVYRQETACTVVVECADGPLDDDLIAAFTRKIGTRVLPLDTPPLLTAGVLSARDGTDACLVISVHHIAADLVSLDLILSDFVLAYGQEGQVATPAPSFGRHAAAAAAEVDSPRWRQDLAYWKELLAGAPARTDLPFHTARQPTPTSATTVRRLPLTTELTGGIDELLRARASSAFPFFLSCLGVVLSAWAATRTVVVGVPALRRRDTVEQNLVGFLLSTLPIRIDVEPDATFTSLLEQVRDRCAAARDYDTPTFDALVAELGVATEPGRNPVFTVWVNDVSQRAPLPARTGLEVTRLRPAPMGALFDLNVYLHRGDHGFELEIVTATDAFRPPVVQELLDQCRLVIEQVVADPLRAVASLSLCTPAGRAAGAVLDGPVLYTAPGPDPVDRFRRRAEESGDRTAIVEPHGGLTYRELLDEVERLAAELAVAGVCDGDVVELRTSRDARLATALLAVWRSHAVAALVDGSLPATRIEAMSSRLDARYVIDVADGCAIRKGTGGRRLPGMSHILFTSGSDAEPAAVPVSRTARNATVDWYLRTIDAGPADRVAMLAGLGHDPVLRDILVPLVAGGVLVVPERDVLTSPVRLARFVVDQGVTILHATPALLELVTAGAAELAEGSLASLRLVVSAGGPLTAALVRRLRRHTTAEMANAFGTTETPQIAAWSWVATDEDLPDGLVPVGGGTGPASLVVVTPRGEPAAVGQRGEILVRGRYLAEGYLADDTRSGGFAPDPGGAAGVRAFRTGDLGRLDPTGAVHLDGRMDRQLQVDGFRVEPAEIEAAALRIDGVRQAVASLVRLPLGDALTLHVVPDDDTDLDPADLRRRLRLTLPPHAVPARVRLTPALRTTHNHKFLAEPADAFEPVPALRAARGGHVHETVLAAVHAMLGRPVRADENFFEAGLNSVSLVRLHAELRRTLGVELPVSDLFAHPSAHALASHLTGEPVATPMARSREPAEDAERMRKTRGDARVLMRRYTAAGRGDR